MSNSLSPELLAQLYAQESNDPFLTLVTLNHSSFPSPLRFVDNTEDITSRGNVFKAFPVAIVLPVDDGESERVVKINFDNVSLELIDEIRTVTTQIGVSLELVLASSPNQVQMSLEELKIGQVSYNASAISCTLVMDDFLGGALTSERYTPTSYPGIF